MSTTSCRKAAPLLRLTYWAWHAVTLAYRETTLTATAEWQTFTDGSPRDSAYSPHSNCTWVVLPSTPGGTVELRLERLDLEASYDFLYVRAWVHANTTSASEAYDHTTEQVFDTTGNAAALQAMVRAASTPSLARLVGDASLALLLPKAGGEGEESEESEEPREPGIVRASCALGIRKLSQKAAPRSRSLSLSLYDDGGEGGGAQGFSFPLPMAAAAPCARGATLETCGALMVRFVSDATSEHQGFQVTPRQSAPLYNFVPRGLGFVHHSIATLCHEVPNLTIRNFCFCCTSGGVPHAPSAAAAAVARRVRARGRDAGEAHAGPWTIPSRRTLATTTSRLGCSTAGRVCRASVRRAAHGRQPDRAVRGPVGSGGSPIHSAPSGGFTASATGPCHPRWRNAVWALRLSTRGNGQPTRATSFLKGHPALRLRNQYQPTPSHHCV